MSRPHKATVDYFPHYVNSGKTMFTIESKFGNDGYAFWYKILEILGSTEHHFIDCNNDETWEYLLAKTHVNEITANNILDTCSKLNAIDPVLWTHKIVRSMNFIENLNSVYRRREINVFNNNDILGLCKQKPMSNEVIVDKNLQSKVKYSKVKKSKINIENENTLCYNLTQTEKILLESETWKESVARNYNIEIIKVDELIKKFISNCKVQDIPIRSMGESKIHFSGWANKNKDLIQEKKAFSGMCR
jgi:hypothetical protein